MSKFAGKGPNECHKTLEAIAVKARAAKASEDGTPVKVPLYDLEGTLDKLSVLERDAGLLNLGLGSFKFEKQTTFGAEVGSPDAGNCFQVCVATVLGLPVSAVPHFYRDNSTVETANRHIGSYLLKQQRMIAHYEWETVKLGRRDGWLPGSNDVLVIISGKSPRGDFLHAVVGVLDSSQSEGWRMLHDPHPDSTGIVGEPTGVEFITKFPKVTV